MSSGPFPMGEIALAPGDFERVRRMIKERAGIHLQPSKQSMVQGRLARLLREHGLPGYSALLDAVQRPDSPLWQPFVNALTTNLTSFFREAYHFPLLAEFLAKQSGPVRIWCAAASTGEEPWSIAMTALETLGTNAPVSIHASDIDTDVLRTARAGVYPLDGADKGLDATRLRRWFLKGTGANAGRIRVRPELARIVEFGQVNLVHDALRFPQPFDVVFCRNVMIYFDAPTQRQVLARIHRTMRPGGLLFVGHSENFSSQSDLFALRGKTVYERLAERSAREPECIR
ncbi:MAG TPA: CheR family methyltransferase [Burkholderiaceae bacterium]|nr:CheR family methyltransferase [Burkholderiaceae bacterium]